MCPLHPISVIVPFCRFMSFRFTVCSSCASIPHSFSSVKITEYLGVDAEIMRSISWVVGICGGFLSYLNFGFCHFILLSLQNRLYNVAYFCFVWLVTLRFAMKFLTCSGSSRLVFRSMMFRMLFNPMRVVSAFPRLFAFIRVCIIIPLFLAVILVG